MSYQPEAVQPYDPNQHPEAGNQIKKCTIHLRPGVESIVIPEDLIDEFLTSNPNVVSPKNFF